MEVRAHVKVTSSRAAKSLFVRKRMTDTNVSNAASAKWPPGDTRIPTRALGPSAASLTLRVSRNASSNCFWVDSFKDVLRWIYLDEHSTGTFRENVPRPAPGSV